MSDGASAARAHPSAWLSRAFAPGHKHVCPPDPPQGSSPEANPGSSPEGLVGWCLRSTLLLGEGSMRSQRPCSRYCSLLVRANDRWVSKSQDVAVPGVCG